MKNLFIILFGCILFACNKPQTAADTTPPPAPLDTTPKPVEIGDAAMIETGKLMFAAMADGNMDKYSEPFADN